MGPTTGFHLWVPGLQPVCSPPPVVPPWIFLSRWGLGRSNRWNHGGTLGREWTYHPTWGIKKRNIFKLVALSWGYVDCYFPGRYPFFSWHLKKKRYWIWRWKMEFSNIPCWCRILPEWSVYWTWVLLHVSKLLYLKDGVPDPSENRNHRWTPAMKKQKVDTEGAALGNLSEGYSATHIPNIL